jgi:cysteine-rich repeat protein
MMLRMRATSGVFLTGLLSSSACNLDTFGYASDLGTSDGTSVVPTTSETTDSSETTTSDTPTTTMPEPVCNNDSVCDPGEDGIEGCMDCLSCGNGVMEGEEECDDGNPSNSDECVSCNNARCGDGFRQAGVEVCDDGDGVNSDAYTGTAHCNSTCTANVVYCGDGVCQQEFEDIGSCMQDGCMGTCGNGVMEPGEDCDEGEESMSCDGICSAVMCGDGYTNVVAGEECDDANDVDTDACLAGCIAAKCGDGVVQAGVEECDDGNQDDTDTCDTTCNPIVRRKVFVTSLSYKGSLGGLSGADGRCQARANAAGLSGKFKAWLSDDNADFNDPASRFDTSFTGFYELAGDGGAVVAHGWSGLTTPPLAHAIDQDEMGTQKMSAVTVWTNTTAGGNQISGKDCDSWSDDISLERPTVGLSNKVDTAWTMASADQTCDTARYLYCFEDPT